MKTTILYLGLLTFLFISCTDSSSSDPDGSDGTALYAYITDGTDFKVIDIATPNAPAFLGSTPMPTGYFVSVSPDIAYVAQYDATAPYVNFVNISTPNNPNSSASIAKNNTLAFSLLSDMYTLQDISYLTDTYRGIHVVDIAGTNFTSQLNMGGDAMSVTKINNTLFVIDQTNGLHSYDVTSPGTPVATTVSNTTDVDTASYPDAPFGQHHSWVENDGTYIYVANSIDKKLKKFDATTLVLIDEYNYEGYATALAIKNGFAFITCKNSANAPLQNGFDGIRMIELSTMTMADFKVLSRTSGVALQGDYAYVTDADGLHVYNISSGDLTNTATLATGFGNFIALGE